VVLNPAAQLVEAGDELERLLEAWNLEDGQRAQLREAGGACVLLYRAQGRVDPEKEMAPSYLGRAVFTPRLDLVHRWDQPALSPDEPFHDLGLEDARCTRVGERYYLYYTGYASPPPGEDDRTVRVCLATTRDFLEWELHGPVEHDWGAVPNKNAALLPGRVEAIGDRYVLLHRPMAGPDAMTIHWATSESPAGPWATQGVLMASYPYREFASSWIGAGGPPVALGDGRYLAIYHQGHFTEHGEREYDLAAALLDFRRPDPVLARIEPLMRPTGKAEVEGDPDLGVGNVLFSCANYRWEGDLIVPYAGADSRIFGASLVFDDLLGALEQEASARVD
jgi:predicted GH43/DUF377 family glycosyl hydrolase